MKLLLSLAILIATTPAFARPPENSAVIPETLSGDYTTAKAMTTLYGSYDEAKKISAWDVTRQGRFPLSGDGPVNVQILLDALYYESGVKKHLLFTWARHFLPGKGANDFDPNTCHACGVVLGFAIFAQAAPGWHLESQKLKWKQLGAWGSPPNSLTLAEIGENMHAIVIHQADMHQGIFSSYFSAYALRNGQEHALFSELTEDFSMVDSRCDQNLRARDNKVSKAQAQKMCSNPEEKIEFVSPPSSTPKQTYYDLKLIRTFHGAQGIEPVEINDLYTFNNATMRYARKPASK